VRSAAAWSSCRRLRILVPACCCDSCAHRLLCACAPASGDIPRSQVQASRRRVRGSAVRECATLEANVTVPRQKKKRDTTTTERSERSTARLWAMPWALVELDANQRDGAVPPIQLQFLGRQRFTQSRKPIRPRGFTPRGDARPARQERGEHPNAAPPREALRQSEASQNLLQAVHAAQAPPLPPHPHSAAHVADAERCEPSHRAARVLPVKRQPSPRINIRTIPALVLTGMEERGGGIRSARFTPRSQAQEDAKAAHRRSIANGAMKKLM